MCLSELEHHQKVVVVVFSKSIQFNSIQKVKHIIGFITHTDVRFLFIFMIITN